VSSVFDTIMQISPTFHGKPL